MKTQKFVRCGAHLPVINLRQTLDYYRDTLGFYDEWTEGNTDGGIRRDDMRLLFGENPDHVEKVNGAPARLNLMWFVDNIDEVYAEFKERGVKLSSDLQTYPYGLREFAFIDINGYYIRVTEGG
ncbi:MAG TPA: VOC family protein [Mucilaginibacter sp.]